MKFFDLIRGRRRTEPARTRPARPAACRPTAGRRKAPFERLEARELLSADPLQLGAVYYEDAMAGGTDDTSPGDLIHISFDGGAAGTQLTQVAIDLNPDNSNFQIGDIYFDTAPGGRGESGSIPLSIVSNQGIDSISFHVTSNGLDGRTQLIISFTGFDAGDKLTIGFDVDEVGNGGDTPTVEGREFEGATITGTFSAATYYDATLTATFRNVYDQATIGTNLDLPDDDYVPPNTVNSRDYTAGGFVLGQQESLPITLSGTVYHDDNVNNRLDSGEQGIAGVRLDLQVFDGNGYVSTGRSTVTDDAGSYEFADLDPGRYRVVETQPDDYYSVGATAGTVDGQTRGSVLNENVIQEIELVGGNDSVHNNFAEARYGSLAGHVYHDADNDGIRDAGETGISGVTLRLYDADGNFTGRTATTDANGEYEFDRLEHGVYSIAEVQPSNYADGLDAAGSLGGIAQNPGDLISGIVLPPNTDGVNYDFGELIPASISGSVHADLDGDCEIDPGEPMLAGVQVDLLDAAGNVIAVTYTDQNGQFTFDGLAPGTYSLREHTPEGYLDGCDEVGSHGGTEIEPDTISGITVASGDHAVDYHFCEIVPASLAGTVYHDTDNDGVRDPGEAGIGGATLELLDENGAVVATVTTDANGNYEFDMLYAGTYSIRERQPSGWLDGLDSAGTLGGTAQNPGDLIANITILTGQHGHNYDFGEVLPASLSGTVFGDLNENCRQDGDESGIAGVTIQLFDASGNLVRTTTTDADGNYAFDMLPPGTYTVHEIQPAGYFQGCTQPGSNGGEVDGDTITEVVLESGDDAIEYNYGEIPYASISGRVYQDGPTIIHAPGTAPDTSGRDGQWGAGDTPISGVTLCLTDAQGNVLTDANGAPIRAVTDANGNYTFDGLRAGTYGVIEQHPTGYVDWIDHPGSAGGTATNPGDRIQGIVLSTGQRATEYHFSELNIRETPPGDPPPQDPPPQTPPPVLLSTQPAPIPYIASPPVVSIYAPNLGPGVPMSNLGPAGGADDYAWHLSVVDGGEPRGDEFVGNGWRTVTPAALAHNIWLQTDVSFGDWSFARGTGDEPNHYADGIPFGLIDGIPISGDFDGDGKTEVGIYRQGQWFVDLNGNGRWDEGDLWAELGRPDDLPVTGDWDGDGKTDIGVFGPQWEGDERAIVREPGLPGAENVAEGTPKNLPPEEYEAPVPRRLLKRTSSGPVREDLIDHTFTYGQAGDLPFAGDWNGSGSDKIGVFREGRWLLDLNGNGKFDGDDLEIDWSGLPGLPVTGDFDGDGIDDLGLAHEGKWHIDTNHDGKLDALDLVFEHGTGEETPISGDWDGDGKAQPGGYRARTEPDRGSR